MKGFKLRTFKDHRRYDFHRTFGSAITLTDCEFDQNISDFNQNQPNPVTGDPPLPNGCTAFTRTDIAANEDRILYRPGFTYTKSCMIEGIPEGSGLTLESSFKSGVVYGLQAVGETADAQALAHRRGPYFEVTKSNDDWFHSLWSALQTGKKSLSVGTVWYPEMTSANVIDAVQVRPTTDGHNWEVTGVTTQNGIPRMHVKWWGGEPKWFGRAAINALMSYKGSDCLTDVDGKAVPGDIQTVRLTITQVLISYMQRLAAWYSTQQQEGANELTMNEQKMYDAAKAALGRPETLDPSTPIDVRCAEAWSAMATNAGVTGVPASGFENTDQVAHFLATSGQFEEITTPEAGATVIAISKVENGVITQHGHVTICAMWNLQYKNDWGLISNDSNVGIVREQWGYKSFINCYTGLGLQIKIYRRL